MELADKFVYPGGGTGRHAGLKILFPAMEVTVQLRSRVLPKYKALLVLTFKALFIFWGHYWGQFKRPGLSAVLIFRDSSARTAAE